jgi:hypothetical protein
VYTLTQSLTRSLACPSIPPIKPQLAINGTRTDGALHTKVTGLIRNSLDTELTAVHVGLSVANAALAEGKKKLQSSSVTLPESHATAATSSAAAVASGRAAAAGGPAIVSERPGHASHAGGVVKNHGRGATLDIPVSGSSTTDTTTITATAPQSKSTTTNTTISAAASHNAHQQKQRAKPSAVPPPPPPRDRSRGASAAVPPVIEAWGAGPSQSQPPRVKNAAAVHNPPSVRTVSEGSVTTATSLSPDDGARVVRQHCRGRNHSAPAPGAVAGAAATTTTTAAAASSSSAEMTEAASSSACAPAGKTWPWQNQPRRATATATLTRSRPQPLDGAATDNDLGPMSLHRRATTANGASPHKSNTLTRGGGGGGGGGGGKLKRSDPAAMERLARVAQAKRAEGGGNIQLDEGGGSDSTSGGSGTQTQVSGTSTTASTKPTSERVLPAALLRSLEGTGKSAASVRGAAVAEAAAALTAQPGGIHGSQRAPLDGVATCDEDEDEYDTDAFGTEGKDNVSSFLDEDSGEEDEEVSELESDYDGFGSPSPVKQHLPAVTECVCFQHQSLNCLQSQSVFTSNTNHSDLSSSYALC